MKHEALLTISCILALGVVGCEKDPGKGNASKEGFTGETVTVGETRDSYKNLYILNEGAMGHNEASLDFFTPSDGLYVRSAFSQANPSISLGDTANDLIAVGDEIWIAVTGSDLIEIVDAATLAHKASIPVVMPRCLAADNNFVYVTSYNGAYATYSEDFTLTDYNNPKGALYRISIADKRKEEHYLGLGYQPEGLVVSGSNLFIANSGGIASQQDPYTYDNTITHIDLTRFKIYKTYTSVINAKEIFVDSEGTIWEHTLGDFYSLHSGLYKKTGDGAERVTAEGCELCVGAIAQNGDDFWIIGSDTEWIYPGSDWYVYKITNGVATKVNIDIEAVYPYGIAVDPETGDLFITDGGTGGNLGTVYCYSKADNYALKWKTTSGIFPGHFLFL